MFQLRSIYKKLVTANLATALIVLLGSGTLLMFFSDYLIRTFLHQGKIATQQFTEDFKEAGRFSESEIVRIYQEQALKKGTQLIEKDRMSLTTPFIDNQILFIREFITKTFQMDKDIVYAGFFIREGEEKRALSLAIPEFPNGLPGAATFDEQISGWRLASGKTVNDSLLGEHLNKLHHGVEKITYAYRNEKGIEKKVAAIEVYAPIYEGDASELTALIEEGEPIGFLRYIISLEATNLIVQNTKKASAETLLKQESRAKEAEGQMTNLGARMTQNLYLVLAGSTVIVAIIGFVLSALISRRISKPIHDLSKAAKAIAGGDYESSVTKSTQDEIGQLCMIFDDMRIQVKDFTENLQELVEEKTSEIRFLLDNVDLAILNILPNNRIANEYSKSAADMFGDPSQKSTEELFEDLGSKRAANIMNTILGEDELSWVANRNLLPRELKQQDRFFQMTYSPHIDPKGMVSSLLITVNDATELKQLEAKAEAEIRKGRFLLNVAKVGSERIKRYLNNEIKMFESSGSPDHFLKLLHTAKGNSGSFGLFELSESIHHIETEWGQVDSESAIGQTESYRKKVVQMFRDVEGEIEGYFPRNDANNIDDKAETYYQALKKMAPSSKDLQDLSYVLYTKSHVQFKRLCFDSLNQLKETAGVLNKPLPHLVQSHPDYWLKVRHEHSLSGILGHLFRNALDHGIESPEDRLKNPKDPRGSITISVQMDQNGHELIIEDDGGGIDIRQLAANASLGGDALVSSAADLVFQGGMTTKSEVTEISGRGVGLDAVKADIEAMGGKLRIEFVDPSQGGETIANLKTGRLNFRLVIRLPDGFFSLAPQEPLVAA